MNEKYNKAKLFINDIEIGNIKEVKFHDNYFSNEGEVITKEFKFTKQLNIFSRIKLFFNKIVKKKNPYKVKIKFKISKEEYENFIKSLKNIDYDIYLRK